MKIKLKDLTQDQRRQVKFLQHHGWKRIPGQLHFIDRKGVYARGGLNMEGAVEHQQEWNKWEAGEHVFKIVTNHHGYGFTLVRMDSADSKVVVARSTSRQHLENLVDSQPNFGAFVRPGTPINSPVCNKVLTITNQHFARHVFVPTLFDLYGECRSLVKEEAHRSKEAPVVPRKPPVSEASARRLYRNSPGIKHVAVLAWTEYRDELSRLNQWKIWVKEFKKALKGNNESAVFVAFRGHHYGMPEIGLADLDTADTSLLTKEQQSMVQVYI